MSSRLTYLSIKITRINKANKHIKTLIFKTSVYTDTNLINFKMNKYFNTRQQTTNRANYK